MSRRFYGTICYVNVWIGGFFCAFHALFQTGVQPFADCAFKTLVFLLFWKSFTAK